MPPEKYDCLRCVDRGQQNTRRFRLCLFTGYEHVSLEDRPIKDASDFWFRLEEYSQRFPAKDLMDLMGDFKSDLTDRTGLCVKSLQFTDDITTAIQLVNDCTDGDGNLQHLPYPGTILQQPSIFLDFASLVNTERSKTVRKKKEAHAPGASAPPPRAPSGRGRFRVPRPARRRKR